MFRFPDFFYSISIFLCRHAAQEYIRRQLEEEQRQLEILQQQLLQEQALLMVTIALPRASTASHLCCVAPYPHCMHPSGSLTSSWLWGNPQSESLNLLATFDEKHKAETINCIFLMLLLNLVSSLIAWTWMDLKRFPTGCRKYVCHPQSLRPTQSENI